MGLMMQISLANKISIGREVYTVKKSLTFSCPQPGCHLPNSPWSGIIKIFPRQVVWYVTSWLRTEKPQNFFYSVKGINNTPPWAVNLWQHYQAGGCGRTVWMINCLGWLPFRYRSAWASYVWGAGSSLSWGERPKFLLLTVTLKTPDYRHKPSLSKPRHSNVLWSIYKPQVPLILRQPNAS